MKRLKLRLQEKRQIRRTMQVQRRGYVHHRGCVVCIPSLGFLPRRRWNGELDTRPIDEIYDDWLMQEYPEEPGSMNQPS